MKVFQVVFGSCLGDDNIGPGSLGFFVEEADQIERQVRCITWCNEQPVSRAMAQRCDDARQRPAAGWQVGVIGPDAL